MQRPLSATLTKRMPFICPDGGQSVKSPKGELIMNKILKAAVFSFAEACAWGTDFYSEHAAEISTR